MAFREFAKSQTLPETERQVLDLWDRDGTFQRGLEARATAPRFVFYEGPPTANGHPGAHHVLARTIKDIVCRYKTMRGFRVDRKAGWDTHGLPVEIEVERQLKLESKDDIERYGVAEFIRKSRESVFTYKDEWDQLTRRMGYWVDLSDAYVTCTNEYVESVWHILKTMWDRGLIYQGHKILPYCPRCGTPLSSHEVAQGYEDATDPSVFVRMRLKDEPGTSLLVWTTTPWTLISNVALAVAPTESYVKVKQGDEHLILAEARLSVLDGPYEVVARLMGLDLVQRDYEPLYSFVPPDRRAHFVIPAGFVTLDDGTGIVHIAPAFGEDDYQVGKEHDLPFIQPVDGAGRFTPDVAPWAGLFIKDADPKIIADLKARGLLYKSGTIVHTYPFCWRCDSPLVYYARNSWYVRTTQFKDDMIRNNRAIEWHPREIGQNRLGDWLENNVDWAISRDRYWGTPLNVWVCGSCGRQAAVGSVEELRRLSVAPLPEPLDLHKPVVDGVRLKCEACGAEMTRTPEVIDCWFDTGSMPYAQWHWPMEHAREFEEHFPADFIAEGVDQTRGWFYALLAISTIMSGVSSFRCCISNEMVLDKNGKKMSKSVGNTVDSFKVMEKHGADALRWYFLATSPPWVPTRFDEDGVKEVAGKVFDTLRNTYGFLSLYANIDAYDPAAHAEPLASRPAMDRWVVSRLNTTVAEVVQSMDAYDLTKAVRRLQQFVLEDVSNWYVRLSRGRFWKGDMDADKRAAYSTLYEVLTTTVRAMAPFAPFLTEDLHGRLREGAGAAGAATPGSVHLCAFPEPATAAVDAALEEAMETVRAIVTLGRSARNACGIKVRQPLSKLMAAGVPADRRPGVEALSALVQNELNVKELAWVDQRELIVLRAAPVFPALGPKHGKDVNQVADAIRALPADDVAVLSAGASVKAVVSDELVVIEPADVEVVTETPEGLEVQTDGRLAVALDTEITPELRDEGLAREMINKIQFMRKEAGFQVVDRIHVRYEAAPRLRKAIKRFSARIAKETLAADIAESNEAGELQKEWDVNGEWAKISVERVERGARPGSGSSRAGGDR
jgi:isoleucyl-tRNA synthetase